MERPTYLASFSKNNLVSSGDRGLMVARWVTSTFFKKTLFILQLVSGMAALDLQWTFGINSNVPNCVHLLQNNDQNEEIIFYPISNNGVIYNLHTKQQTFLSLHTNLITSSIISFDKQLLILGDSGASNHEAIISIWNASTHDLISKYELPQNCGVQTLSMNKQNTLLSGIINESVASSDGQSNALVQHLIVWSFGNSDLKLLCQKSIQTNDTNDLHHFIAFNQYSSELVTHGQNITNLIFWSIISPPQATELKPYYFVKDANESIDVSSIGKLTASLFFPLQNGAMITATNSGDLIVWTFEDSTKKYRTMNKIITAITRGSINCVCLLRNNDVIALASSAGCVRFYDFEFGVIGWLDYLGDEVTSISFPLNVQRCNIDSSFVVPDMMIGTKNNKVMKVISPLSSDEDATHCVVIDTLNTICNAMASHPSAPIIAVGTKKGEIQLWDIVHKSLVRRIAFQNVQITDIVFSHNGQWLVFGTDTHYLRFYKSKEFLELEFFKTSYDGVIHNMCFSLDDEWFALSQSNRISVYRWWFNMNDTAREGAKEWTLIGNYVSHQKDIVALHFSQQQIPRLFSVGLDNLINEYNLGRSSGGFGLRLKYTFALKHMSVPTAVHFVEDELMVFDDELKIHFYHCPRVIMRKKEEDDEEIEALVFRRTVMAPSYGAPIKKIIPLKNDLLFMTYSQVIGLMCAPFNGNPHRYFGCIAHPANMNGFEMVTNGFGEPYLVTNGGYDESMLIWKVNEWKPMANEGNLNQIYRDLLDEDDVNLYNEMRDYFYYAQIENGSSICDIKQITSIFQALGCFLTLNDVQRIEKEIAYRFGENQINFDQFVQLFVNYRSSFELNVQSINKSFENITIATHDLQYFMDVLQRKGDKMTRDEVMQCLESLTGYTRRQLKNVLPNKIDARFFTKNILGLTLQKQTEK
eukprot:440304_1